jgi:molecular chaperone DnaJ
MFGGIPGGGGGFPGGFGGGGGFAADIGDIFGSFFGGRGRGGPEQAQRGRDLEAEVQLSFDQAMHGTQITVAVPTTDTCPTCHGTGARPGTTPKTCPRCEGRGVDVESQGVFSISQPCPECGGRGEIVEDPCPDCGGAGVTQQTKRYRVNIPAGVHDGSRIRLAGKGEAGPRGGGRGDLYVTVRVTPSPVFRQRPDGNLEVDLPVTIPEAIQGATVEVPTLNGSKRIRIPAGTQHGSTQRLKGEGPPRPKGGQRGDIHYRVQLEIPKDLTSEQRDAVEGLAKALNGNDPRESLLRRSGSVRSTEESED